MSKFFLVFIHFSQSFDIRIKHGLPCTYVCPVPQNMLKLWGWQVWWLQREIDQPILHGWGVEACCPAFPVPEPMQVPGLGWQCHNTFRQNHQNFFHQNNVVRIDWPVRSSDRSTVWRCEGHFLTEYWHPKTSRLSMSRYRSNRGWLLGTNSPELFGVCKASASPTLWLLWDTLIAGNILIFQRWHLRLYVIVKGITFQVLKTHSFFMRCVSKVGILCRHFFAKNDLIS